MACGFYEPTTEFDAAGVALKCKQLWTVESIFRSAKSLPETRPIYQRFDDTIHGRVFCSFLALALRKEPEMRLEKPGDKLETDINRDFPALQEVEMEGKTMLLAHRPAWGLPSGGGSLCGTGNAQRMIAASGGSRLLVMVYKRCAKCITMAGKSSSGKWNYLI
jgi:hypothetical protein